MIVTYLSQLPHWLHQLPTVGKGHWKAPTCKLSFCCKFRSNGKTQPHHWLATDCNTRTWQKKDRQKGKKEPKGKDSRNKQQTMNKQLVLSVSGMQLMDKLELHTWDRDNQLLEGQNTADDDQTGLSALSVCMCSPPNTSVVASNPRWGSPNLWFICNFKDPPLLLCVPDWAVLTKQTNKLALSHIKTGKHIQQTWSPSYNTFPVLLSHNTPLILQTKLRDSTCCMPLGFQHDDANKNTAHACNIILNFLVSCIP
jgi:hypothetical protein